MTKAMPAPLACYHCALPVFDATRFSTMVLGAQRSFCCPGCQAVAETIVANGLDVYYRQRTEPAENPTTLPSQPSDELALYDRPATQASFVIDDATSAHAVLWIEGISCAACGWLIERHVRALPGVAEAHLNLSTHQLHLSWAPNEVPLSHLFAHIRRIGYTAHPYQADALSTQLQRENRQTLRRIGVAGLLWMQVMMASMATWPNFDLDLSPVLRTILQWLALLLTTPIIVYSCAPFFRSAWRDVRHARLSMDVSVALALGSAYAAGIGTALSGQGAVYLDAVGMFALLLLSGRYLERRARLSTATASNRWRNALPASCVRWRAEPHDGPATERILLSEVQLGDRLLIAPGALIPADSVIVEGASQVDEALLTGEYLPQPKRVGATVSAGTLNIDSPLTVCVNAVGVATRLSAIMRLLERAQASKPAVADRADRAAQKLLLGTLVSAGLVGVGWWYVEPARVIWVIAAMLVAACPCALSLAIPTALTTATGTLYSLGVLIARGHVLEGLGEIDTIVFDKTGTLTEGRPSLQRIEPLAELDAEYCLALAAALEAHSEHPIARAFGASQWHADNVRNTPGRGLAGTVAGRDLRLGSPGFVCQLSGSELPERPADARQAVLLGDRCGPLAWLLLHDPLRLDAATVVQACRAYGWRTLLWSGDHAAVVTDLAVRLEIDEAHGDLLPEGKLALLAGLHAQGRKVLCIGDGVNDVPLLAAANISVAMGSGTDLARTNADAVLLADRLSALLALFAMAKRSRRIVGQNLGWAALYNGLMLPLAALGWLGPLPAALGMSLSSLAVVLNALRLKRLPRNVRQ